MELLRFFKIPNEIIQNKKDSEIFTFILLIANSNYDKCELSQNDLIKQFGHDQTFYSLAINNLKKYITIKKNYSAGGARARDTYIINPINEDFTMIYEFTIDRLLKNNYKNLVYYVKLRRWVNDKNLIATDITKAKIGENCGITKKTSNHYLKKLIELNIIKIEDSKYLNCINLILTEEFKIISMNNDIRKYNNFGGKEDV